MKFRKAVSAVVFNENGEFLLTNSQGWKDDIFCFPQGGVEEEELDKDAVERELKEELKTDNFKVLGKSKFVHKYKFTNRKRDGFKEQRQTIWFVKFTGKKEDIKVPNNEIQNIIWVEKNKVLDNMSFEEQKDTFRKVLDEFNYSTLSLRE
ncbi:MAG: NUDIX domain-containing protein [Nitrosopumilaceae archaeon]